MTWWFIIPVVVAILVGAFSEWLKFREKQLQLGDTASHLSEDIDSLSGRLDEIKEVNQKLVERVQNLEAIVTTQMWDEAARETPGLPEGEQNLLDIADTGEDEMPDEEKARKLARRMRR